MDWFDCMKYNTHYVYWIEQTSVTVALQKSVLHFYDKGQKIHLVVQCIQCWHEKCITLYHLGEKAKDIGENATKSEMVADDAWEIAEDIEVCVVHNWWWISPLFSNGRTVKVSKILYTQNVDFTI